MSISNPYSGPAYQPRACDALPENLCLRCGLEGQHQDVEACINALRDALAAAQFRAGRAENRAARLGRRPPEIRRFVAE